MDQATGPTLLGVDVIFAATVLVAIQVLAVMLAIYAAVTIRDPMAKRMKALNRRREQLKAGIVAPPSRKRASIVRGTEATDRVRDLLSSLRILQNSQIRDVEKRLAQAGIRRRELAYVVILAKFIAPLAIGLIGAVVLYWSSTFADWSVPKRLAGLAVLFVVSYKGPDLFINKLVAKRTDAIRKGLPDALDLLVICAEAGQTIDAAFNRVARELGRAYPELGDEFALTAIELSFLAERRQAFENFAHRVDLEAVRGVVTTMIQTERYGTPLAAALRMLSAEFRNERMMRAEEKAARLPAIMTVPLILFILPVLFIVILGPAACSISDAFAAKPVR